MKTITMSYATYLQESGQSLGLCTCCGNRQGGCEPDTRYRRCEVCSRETVFGLEELIQMGIINVVMPEPTHTKTGTATECKKLNPFCAGDDCRYDFAAPFLIDGRTYATDGRVIVRTIRKTVAPIAGKPACVPHNIADMGFTTVEDCTEPFPKTTELRDAVLGEKQKTLGWIKIGGRRIALPYARRIARLGKVSYSPSGAPSEALAFTNAHFAGLIMPLSK